MGRHGQRAAEDAPPGLLYSATVTVPLQEVSTLPERSSAVTVRPKPVPAVTLTGGCASPRTPGLDFERPDIDGTVDDPREPSPADRWSGVALGIDGQCVAPVVDRGAAGQEGDGLGRPAVVGNGPRPGSATPTCCR